ncbi:hypothetical protein ACIGO9_24860 [Nocardia asteroides]|uniref:hypothetical protein n=1 Tax=Nocardia asteroides TaxID=1824 RepID=UPI0037CB22C4
MAGTNASNGITLDKDAVQRAVGELKGTVTELRTAGRDVESHSWGKGRTGPNCEAGRGYEAEGAAIAAGLDRVVTWVKVWTTATETTASVAGAAAITLSEVDRGHAADLNGQAAALPSS